MNLYIIGDVIVPDILLRLKFSCRYEQCGGACCIVGDAGAPVTSEEIVRIQKHFSDYADALEPESRRYLKSNPLYQRDDYGLSLSCLDEDGPCVFARRQKTHVTCVLENIIDSDTGITIRPISCRLFPIRLRSNGRFYILDYERWEECESSWNQGLRLVDFVKDALTDRFGETWVNQLENLMEEKGLG